MPVLRYGVEPKISLLSLKFYPRSYLSMNVSYTQTINPSDQLLFSNLLSDAVPGNPRFFSTSIDLYKPSPFNQLLL